MKSTSDILNDTIRELPKAIGPHLDPQTQFILVLARNNEEGGVSMTVATSLESLPVAQAILSQTILRMERPHDEEGTL